MTFSSYFPKDCIWILNTLKDNGYHGYVVGGCVRDALLDKTPKDFDLTSDATPDEIEKIFKGICTVVPTGKQFGTMTLVIHHTPYEITTFRKDSKRTDGRKPSFVSFSDTIEEDLSRRDFTINAIAAQYDDGTFTLIDPYNGQDDLKNNILRTVGVPSLRFEEDYLRILRGIRFALRYNLTIEEETLNAMQQLKHNITEYISRNRICTELTEIFSYNPPADKQAILFELLRAIYPQFSDIKPLQRSYGQKESQDFFLLRLGLIHHQCSIDFTNTGISNKQQAVLNAIRDLKEETYTEYEWITQIHSWNQNARLILQAYQCLVPDLYHQQNAIIEKIANDPVTFLQLSELNISATILQRKLHLQGAQISRSLQTCLQAVIHHQCDNSEEALLNYLTHTN